MDVFAERKADLVYLTADAAADLHDVDPSKVYIIGGLVDRNRFKNLCQSRAEMVVRQATCCKCCYT